MQSCNVNTAKSLYTLYEALPNEVQQAFLQELFNNQHEKLEELAFAIACQQTKKEGEFITEVEANTFIQSLPQ